MEVVMMTELRELPIETQRDRAIARLKQKKELLTHVFTYVVVNTFIVVIWLWTGAGSFWPIIPMLVWGIGLVFQALDVYRRKPITENEIEHIQSRPTTRVGGQ